MAGPEAPRTWLRRATAAGALTSVAGEAGVKHAFTLLQSEVRRDKQLLGINRVEEMTRDYLMRIPRPA